MAVRRGTARTLKGTRVRTMAGVGIAGTIFGLALTACSGSAANSSNNPGPFGGSAMSTAHDVPNGERLKAILLTSADVPRDFAEESIGAQNSGAKLSTAPPTVDLDAVECDTVLNLINTVGQKSLGEAAYASDAFTPPSGLGEFDETLLEFHGDDAAAFTGRLGAALKRCDTFQASDAGGATQAATVKVGPGPKLGDESVGFTVTVAIGGQTMVMEGAVVRVGTAVMVIDNSLLQGQSTEIDLVKLGGILVQRIRALH